MKITTEEMSFLWKLALESVQKESEPPKPEVAYREPPSVKLEPLPKGESALLYIRHAIRSLEQICLKNRCASCPMYRGTSACSRNLLIQVERNLSKEAGE